MHRACGFARRARTSTLSAFARLKAARCGECGALRPLVRHHFNAHHRAHAWGCACACRPVPQCSVECGRAGPRHRRRAARGAARRIPSRRMCAPGRARVSVCVRVLTCVCVSVCVWCLCACNALVSECVPVLACACVRVSAVEVCVPPNCPPATTRVACCTGHSPLQPLPGATWHTASAFVVLCCAARGERI
jgi:hypothetical protein